MTSSRSQLIRLLLLALAIFPSLVLVGCGKTVRQMGTEQLLTSNAVDRVVAKINFSPLANQKVYFDHQYIRNIKGVGFVNGDYIISSIRQQLIAANCLIQDKEEDADYIVEARVGALGMDHHQISYGIPANNLLNTASALVPSAPTIPTIPEISIAKKDNQIGAAKIGVFAYHRESKQPVWQAGVQSDRSRSKQSWFMGAGPFQSGTIYDGPMFAGSRIRRPFRGIFHRKKEETPAAPDVNYNNRHLFPLAQQLQEQQKHPGALHQDLQWANHESEKTGKANTSSVKPASGEKPAKK